MTTGWTCAQCGAYVRWNASHACPVPGTGSVPTGPALVITAPGPLPTYSTGPRKYHISGTISPKDRAGKSYDVDLVMVAIP